MWPNITPDHPVNEDCFTVHVYPACLPEGNIIVLQLKNRGVNVQWQPSHETCIEHAEAEAERIWPFVKEINGLPVLQEQI
jgi:hypothetical protein